MFNLPAQNLNLTEQTALSGLCFACGLQNVWSCHNDLWEIHPLDKNSCEGLDQDSSFLSNNLATLFWSKLRVITFIDIEMLYYSIFAWQ